MYQKKFRVKVVNEFLAGVTLQELNSKYGVAAATVTTWRRQLYPDKERVCVQNKASKKKSYTDRRGCVRNRSNKDVVLERLISGESIDDLVRETKIPRSTLNHWKRTTKALNKMTNVLTASSSDPYILLLEKVQMLRKFKKEQVALENVVEEIRTSIKDLVLSL